MRLKLIQSNIRAVAALFGEDSPEHQREKDELEALLKA